ncbi:hypothetical protein K6119_11105 [Paracrocinitomix mangrovi]|uniref:hypothetical protein n=1 Tax=Paracrocinitomix mangrovi TaxID=2862509 RepID=UPI001C8ED55A|nr:hypothetical protein [Paracrocinitomix mangrovi]UKN00282.1 hypothetical protein K6119_11105 [Paracrocinitomix mangrovi]
MTRYVWSIALLFVSFNIKAQQLSWVSSVGGGSLTDALDFCVDDSGNTVIIGTFNGTADFDPGPNSMLVNANGQDDLFVLKLNDLGELIWVKSIGSSHLVQASNIALDQNNDIIISGSFSGTVDFNPDAGDSTITSNGNYDIFILKLNSIGEFQWVKQTGGTDSEVSLSMVTDLEGNIIIVGFFQGQIDSSTDQSGIYLNASGNYDTFICKYDVDGNLIWAQRIGGDGLDTAYDVDIDSSNALVICGSFAGIVDFDNSAQTTQLTSNGDQDAYVLKLDADGN